jgi:phenylalanyl-tRNA synthetase alpha chain
MADAGQASQTLSNPEKRILNALRGKGIVKVSQITSPSGLSEAEVGGAVSWLQAKGLVKVDDRVTSLVALADEGRRYSETGLPERLLHRHALKHQGRITLSALAKSGWSPEQIQIALAWWKRKGLGSMEKTPTDTIIVANATAPPVTADEELLSRLRGAPPTEESVLPQEPLRMLRSRQGVLKLTEERERSISLTDAGRSMTASELSVQAEISQMTPEIIQSGEWRSKAIRPYDVNSPAPRPQIGKPHPLVQLIEEIRDIFVELGFQEIEEEYVVPALWNMDALFIPQDHPAREMQDTFYLSNPERLPVEADVIEKVRKVHEKGGGTGSRGWGGKFDDTEAGRALLRTHTTVGTIRHLAKHPDGPLRVFSIGRVFRKETMDATHLPEFHQIEGIATEPGADFRMLLGILKEFYKRLGFPELRWRPAYFPYTEPSMEVEVWTGEKWMELGGCGIFRPEVTVPFGVKTPVLAWGLGLERLAMRRFGLSDIRQLYISDIEWLRKQPLL